ncbi:ATP-binding sensor histidine kinase [Bacillus sp. FSL K6-3431]|uniref:ATP-binding sensor histidine kinase n=1 Tax=Bacillus sp. FSL K6-3431 TaxID=2921500 RepID=UPI0030FC854C
MNKLADQKVILPGYDILEEMEANSVWAFYKAMNSSSRQVVLIKKLQKHNISAQDLAAATHEFNLVKDLRIAGILTPITLEKHWNQPFLIVEPFDAYTLSSFIQNKPVEIRSFFRLAKQLTSIVDKLHQNHVIHKSLQPENILIHKKSGEVKLTGFYHAAMLKSENHRSHANPYTLGSQLNYISPEQTGRINRHLDYRSDLYSLGVVFYQMLTGMLPFDQEDPIELVHSHIAKNPIPPIEVVGTVPKVMSDIIMKLLSKMPEDRYQSATGLGYDLIEFEKLWHVHGTNSLEFLMAEKDIPQNFEIGGKLYGREEALGTLISAFERTCNGQCTFALIPGISGIGKTALVNEVRKQLIHNKGYFIAGKFDQLKREVPYAPLVQAFQDLLKQVMAEGEKSIQYWKSHLESELSANLAVLTKIIPEIKWMTGELSEPEMLTAVETNNRIRFAFLKLINIFASEQHPLVLFLDDLQWADQATLDLLQYILAQQKRSYLFIIAAYRDDEVAVTHPFNVMLKDLQTIEGLIQTIPLKPLEMEHLEEWVLDTLSCEDNEAIELAIFMQQITRGNPFFLNQLFQAFYDQQLLVYDEEKMKWTSDFQKLFQLDIQGDIITFIAKRFYKLPEETQKLLKLASCIGNQFEINVLSAVYENSNVTTVRTLWNALRDGLILPLSPRYKWVFPNENLLDEEKQPLIYRFLHDRVQQAVYSTMTTSELEQNHLTIGRLIVNYYTRKGSLEENIFEVVNHLNQCRNLLNTKERIQLAKWNAIAGEKAKHGAAFKASLSFFEVGKELLGDTGWDLHHKLTAKILIGLGETEYLDNQFTIAEGRFDEALDKVQSRQEQLKIYHLKMTLYIHVHRVEDAVDCGLKALELFGWHINKRPGKMAVAKEFLQTKIALRNRKAKDLNELPEMTNENQRLIMQTFINMNGPAYHVDQNLATLLMLKAFNYTLKYGITDLSSLVYNNYALILSAGFHQYNDCYEFGNLALQNAEKSQNSHLMGRVYFVFGSFVNHWKNPIRYNQQYLERSQKYCIESGNSHLAGAASSFICIASFLKGHGLAETDQTINEQLRFSEQIQYDLSKNFLNDLKYWIYILREAKEVPNWDVVQMTDDKSAEIVHYTVRLQLSYILNEQEVAKILRQKLDQLVDKSLVLVIAPEYYFYEDLWMTKQYDSEGTKGKLRIRKRLKMHLSLWRKWALQSPDNYLHKYLLIKAEVAKIKKRISKAAIYYDQSIAQAQKNGYIQDTAIANECAGLFYLNRGLPYFAKVYILTAYSAYESWGASRKALQLRKEFDELLTDSGKSLMIPNSKEQFYIDIDEATMLKAAQAISGEIVLEKLISRLLNIVLENGGAQKGVLFLKIDDQLKPVAQGNIDEIVMHIADKDVVEYPENILQYVEKSLEPVVLTDGADTGIFMNDHYMKVHRPKSVLCFPILYQRKLVGALFLENNMITHAFTKERIELLNFLSSQAAVSLENAYLYRDLEKKVKERTILLESAYENLEMANQDLALAEEVRRKFLSDISHDLRTPITSIQGYIEGILDGVIDNKEERELYLKRSHQRLLTLKRLIDDLFELAKLESRGMSFDMEYVPSDQLFDHLCKQFEHDIIQANLTFTVKIDRSFLNEYPLVEVDVRRIEQLVQNLISNAIKFTQSGEIVLQYMYDKFNKEVVLILKDTGMGIPKDELPLVFDRFYTKSPDRKEGHGLGLAICKEIIQYHKGKIIAESIEGSGSIFTIRLLVYELKLEDSEQIE